MTLTPTALIVVALVAFVLLITEILISRDGGTTEPERKVDKPSPPVGDPYARLAELFPTPMEDDRGPSLPIEVLCPILSHTLYVDCYPVIGGEWNYELPHFCAVCRETYTQTHLATLDDSVQVALHEYERSREMRVQGADEDYLDEEHDAYIAAVRAGATVEDLKQMFPLPAPATPKKGECPECERSDGVFAAPPSTDSPKEGEV